MTFLFCSVHWNQQNSIKQYFCEQLSNITNKQNSFNSQLSVNVTLFLHIILQERYEQILVGNQIVESHLHKHLIEHLNAEIFLGTIHDVTVAMNWIRSTFLYVRVCRSPQNYGMTRGLNVDEVECRLKSK